MSIKRIEIKGFRSINNLDIDAKQITSFIGQNGSGKSNILLALKYFYKNLLTVWDDKSCFDINNVLRNEICIRITYDLTPILKAIRKNLKEEKNIYENYYKKILAISKNGEIVVEFVKRKKKEARWNINYNIRQIIASLFPVYFIDSRKIDLTDWTNLWDLIGDLIKLRNEDSKRIREDIQKRVEEEDESVAKKLHRLSEIFENRNVNVKHLTSRQLGKMLAEITMDGQMFQYDEKDLGEYSNGTNAYNYTCFLIDILSVMNRYKLKEPVVVLDEPEISLHHVMIDSLMEKIFCESNHVQFLMSTHSSRCVKALLENEYNISRIYHVVLKEKYTKVKCVRSLTRQEVRERFKITESYTSSCFAKMILNVEGESELEVFKNKYLRAIFPVLKEVEIVTGMSNKVVHNLTAPSKRNYQVSGMAIIDMDKVLIKKEKENTFLFKELKDYPIDREKYLYGDKRQETLEVRRRIKGMCNKCKFSYRYPLFSCNDLNFECLLDLIINYYKNYDVHVWRSTIEGALITSMNKSIFLEYVNTSGLSNGERGRVLPHWGKVCTDDNLSLNYLRVLFSGKSDYLLTKKQIKNQNPKIDEALWNTLNMVNKTSGWISQWLEFYFLNLSEINKDKGLEYYKFCQWLQKDSNQLKIEKKVQLSFPELYALIQKIEVTLR